MSFRPWMSAVLIATLIALPSFVSADFPPEELADFIGLKSKAEKGDGQAQFTLGLSFFHGRGVEKDEVEAAKWLRKAAEQGHTEAQYTMGIWLRNGTGVAKDELESFKWYRRAADKGYPLALNALGGCYERGEGVVKDEVAAYAYYNLAAVSMEEARFNRGKLEKSIRADSRILGQQRTKELQKEIEAKMASKRTAK
jgi:TPR repeat protein